MASDMLIFAIVLAGAVLLLIFLFVRLSRAQAAISSLKDSLSEKSVEIARYETSLSELSTYRNQFEEARRQVSEYESRIQVTETRLEERERALRELEERFRSEFKVLASEAVKTSHGEFLEKAEALFKEQQSANREETTDRHVKIEKLVDPIAKSLANYDKELKEFRSERSKREGEIRGTINDLVLATGKVRDETNKLVNALRASPKTRGQWGENALKRIIELSGLTKYCDFLEQEAHRGENGRAIPDVVVRLPGDRRIVVDAKVSLNSYLDAVDCEDETERDLALTGHLNAINAHIKNLSSKEYAKAVANSFDFVLLFIPGDNFLNAAVEKDPTLWERAFDAGVLIATPTTLMAVLKSIAYGWRQEKASENAERVAKIGKELYESLQTMGDKLLKVGNGIDGSVKAYNDLVGNIEGRVMPRARKFSELEIEGTRKEIEVLSPLERDVRNPRADRDLKLTDQSNQENSAGE